MKDIDVTERNSFANETKINFHMFCALVMDRISGKIYSANVSALERIVKLAKELTKPASFGDCVCNATIFCFRTKPENGILMCGGPKYEIATKKNTVPQSRFACIQAAGPIGVRIRNKITRRTPG